MREIIKNKKIDKKRKRIIKDVNDGSIRTIQNKVALLLEKHIDTRNSDITLQLKYWEKYEDIYNGRHINPDDLYKLPKLTSLVRARAFIQNTLGLYTATEKVREARKNNEAEHRDCYKNHIKLPKSNGPH